ncbi:MAG: phosphodiester glycosidase family protein [bacterium]|nr:phosphodiester glycosidase family protein [bacterium]
MRRRIPAGAAYAVLILALTGFILFDTFLREDIYQAEATASESASAFEVAQDSLSGELDGGDGYSRSAHGSSSGIDSSASAGSSTDTDYSDGDVEITVTECIYEDTHVYVADVQVSSAQYLKAAFANGSYGKNITATTSDMAEDCGATLAINGDYYGAQESGYVIRNGVLYRSTSKSDTEIACIYADGTMEIANTGDVSAEELVDQGVWQVFSFGPALIEDGQIAVTADEEVGKAMASNPRTAIGMISANHYVFVVSDGRTDESEGLSLKELATFMKGLGVTCAYNLDGGGSSTMYYDGEVVNNPTTSGNSTKERKVSDIVYIG